MNSFDCKNRISFGSLSQKKRLAQEVMREFNHEYGYLLSSSRLYYRRKNIEQKLPRELNFGLIKLTENIENRIYNWSFLHKFRHNRFKSYDELNLKLKKNVEKKNNMANCWASLVFMFDKLTKRGEKPFPIELKMKVRDKDYPLNHFTNVLKLKKTADIQNPKTWGTKAYIIDPWSGLYGPAKDVLRQIEEFMSKGHEVISFEYSPYNIDRYIKK